MPDPASTPPTSGDDHPDRAPALVSTLDVPTSGVLVCDASAAPGPVITYVHGAFERILGRTAGELVGGHVAALVGESVQDEEARHALAAALRDGRPHEAAFTMRRRDGSAFRAEMRITPVRDGGGATTDWIAVVDDVTEPLAAPHAPALP